MEDDQQDLSCAGCSGNGSIVTDHGEVDCTSCDGTGRK
jgi:hypothetical protein